MALLWAVIAPPTPAPAAEPEADNLAIQESRAQRVKDRAARAYYTKRWNLDDLPLYVPRARVSGTLRIWGSNYFTDCTVAKRWEEGFRRHHPDVRFEYNTPTVLVAASGLYQGFADIGVSRRFTFDEILAYQRVKGHHPSAIAVATGSYNVPGWSPALGIYVHEDNPLRELTLEQLDGIFGAERTGGYDDNWSWRPERGRGPEKNIRTWGQLGLRGEWANQPITPYGLNLKYHQQFLIERRAFRGGNKWNERLREYAHYTREDGTSVISNQQLLADLGKDRHGIAYSNAGYVKPEHGVRAVAVADDGGKAVELSLDTVRDRRYPLFDELYFYYDDAPRQAPRPVVQEFLRYVLSREAQQGVMEDAKWLPLTGEVVRTQLRTLEGSAKTDAETANDSPRDDTGAALAAIEALPPYRPVGKASGTLRLWGHGSFRHDFMRRLVSAWQEQFVRHHPDVTFDYRMYGTASAVGALYTDAGDIAILGEEISPAAARAFKRARGYAHTDISIATGSVDVNFFDYAHMIFVHRDNPLTRLSLPQLDAVFGAEHRRSTRNIRTWGELGLTGEWASRRIQPYGWKTDVDFALFFRERVLGNSHRWNADIREFVHARNPDGTQYDHGQRIIDALAQDPGGIAISNVRYATDDVKALALAWREEGPWYEPTVRNLVSQDYPLGRIIPAIIDRAPGRPVAPAIREFLRYVLSREGQRALVEHSGYLPLAAPVAAAQLEKLE